MVYEDLPMAVVGTRIQHGASSQLWYVVLDHTSMEACLESTLNRSQDLSCLVHCSVLLALYTDGRIHFDLSKLKTPFTEEQIVEIVKDAHQNNRAIRVLADGHSWSEISQTQDIMISLANYSGILGTDEEKMEAIFKAGTPLRNISLELDKRGLAMIQLGSVASQSIAGAISTGTVTVPEYIIRCCSTRVIIYTVMLFLVWCCVIILVQCQ